MASKDKIKELTKKVNLRGIVRIDSGSTFGWYVKISYKGKIYSAKLFSDLKCGGIKTALRMAIEHRDNVFLKELKLSKVPPQRKTKPHRHYINKSGIKYTKLVSGKRYWTAFPPKGSNFEVKSANFSIEFYGKTLAKAFAQKQHALWKADMQAGRPQSERIQCPPPGELIEAAMKFQQIAELILADTLANDKPVTSRKLKK